MARSNRVRREVDVDGGIHHLVWDTVRGFKLCDIYTSGWIVPDICYPAHKLNPSHANCERSLKGDAGAQHRSCLRTNKERLFGLG
ncbi:hypothetical protein BN961_03223 [Afipia felis]|uniref:Uncharacterized protein n=1 Tax=Afipia felis TaxID=1035 RepID=A0A090MR07_AFIFE|nr:hypothetical protein AfiDRAFT_3720 [Afipia sp. 1NLS2]CEG09791.1 hypothetical protein BN961_03223 [Afipia felis]